MNGREPGRKCAARGAPIRGGNICEKCHEAIKERGVRRRRPERAILYEFAIANLAEPCSDGDCVLGHPGGMHTNGGCRCGRLEGGAQVIWLGRLRRMLAGMAAEIAMARAAKGDHGEA